VAVTRETLRLIGQIRIQIGQTVDAATDDLVRSWANAWTLVVDQWEDAIADLQAQSTDGKWPSHSTVMRAEKAQAALAATYESLTKLGEHAGVRIMSGVSDVVEAAQGHVDVIGSQLPVTAVELRGSLVRADPAQIDAIVTRTREQVTKTLFPLAGDSYDIIRNNLIRGVALGKNPRVTAREMVRGLEVGYNQALTRAMVIARTETLDAHRTAALQVQKANADVLEEWVWLSALDRGTCPSCFAKHGTAYPIDEPGPEDHPQGRCTRMAKTKSWKDLGFDIVEPPSLLPDARTVFDNLPRGDQLAIMGKTRLQLLDDGDIDWADLSMLRHNPGWRDSYSVRPLKSLTSS